ncbi:MAG: alpha/beta fold hydrolase [Deltaproteobacteria bacterium]|nr:alpha/beta fold hydrolase [Deltaproteobacteria bacterium]
MFPSPEPLIIDCPDGYGLRGSTFTPTGQRQRQGTVIVCPAILVRERFYHPFAAYLARRGWHVITFANRGQGLSLAAETRRWDHQLRHWGERDLPAVIDHAAGAHPDHRLCVVGHSMGGQLVALSEAVHRLAGIVTVAATAAWWGHWPFPTNLGILAGYRLASVLTRALPVFPADRFGLGPDVDARLVRDWVTWGRHRDYLAGPFGLDLHMEDYRGRLLVYSFTDDEHLGCRRAVEAIHRPYVHAEVTHHHADPRQIGVPRLGHFGYFREGLGTSLWEQTIAWMD